MIHARTLALLLAASSLFAAGCCRRSEASGRGAGGAPTALTPPPVAATPEFLTVPGTMVELRAPAGWSRARRGEWGLLSSPDKKALLAFIELDRPSEATAKLGQAASVLETSDIRWKNPKAITIGPDSFAATAADGTCRYPSGEGVISYATVNPRNGNQLLVVYAFNKEAPEGVRRQALDTIGSLRKKR